MDSKEEHKKVISSLVTIMKSKTAVAKALGVSRQLLNYWFNHANKIPHEKLMAMKILLRKKQFEAKIHSGTSNQESSSEKGNSSKTKIKINRWVNLEIYQNTLLSQAEEQYHLPLRLAYIGLLACCDENGDFFWEPLALKTKILPFIDVDFTQLLEALHHCGFIQKDEIHGHLYGHIHKLEQWTKRS